MIFQPVGADVDSDAHAYSFCSPVKKATRVPSSNMRQSRRAAGA